MHTLDITRYIRAGRRVSNRSPSFDRTLSSPLIIRLSNTASLRIVCRIIRLPCTEYISFNQLLHITLQQYNQSPVSNRTKRTIHIPQCSPRSNQPTPRAQFPLWNQRLAVKLSLMHTSSIRYSPALLVIGARVLSAR